METRRRARAERSHARTKKRTSRATSARAIAPNAGIERARKADVRQSEARKTDARKPVARKAEKRRVHPQSDLLERVREICVRLPETSEKEAWGTPTFRVRDKMFAMYAEDHHGDGRIAMWCKAGLGVQDALVATDPVSFFVPPYVGVKGWIGVRLDVEVDWDEIGDILADAYQMTAPPKLAATLGPRAH